MKNNCFSLRFLIVLVATLCVCLEARAANFTTTTVQTDPGNFNAAIWQGTAPSAGNTYEVLAGGLIRSVSGAAACTFAGDRLTLDGNGSVTAASTGQLRLKTAAGGGTINILDFHMNGGVLNNGTGSTVPIIQGGTMTIDANSTIDNGSTVGTTIDATRGLTIASTLQGSGQLTIQTGGTTTPVNITGTANTYSGTWRVTGGYLKGTGIGSLGTGNFQIGGANPTRIEFMYDINTAGTLTLTNNAAMVLHQDCTFSAVTINGTALTVGTHPYSELAANFAAYFPAGGSGSITVAAPAPPGAPATINVVNGDTQVSLSWSLAVNAAGYNINRSSTSGGPYVQVGSTGTTNFVDTGLVNGTTNYYVIVSTNSLGVSTNSIEVVGLPQVSVVGITAVGGTNQVAVSWSALAGADSYSVLRATTFGGPYLAVATALTGTSYLDTSVSGGTTYFYRIAAALTDGGVSGQSATVSAITAPNAPILNVVVFAGTVIRVGWTGQPVVSNYLLERSTDGVNFTPLITLAGTALSYTNTGLALNSTYSYRVGAVNGTGPSPYSNIATTNTPNVGSINVNFQSGGNASAGTLNTPTPPGYLGDIGDLFGDRTNGYFYGWTTVGGTNIVRDARWRSNPISPDVRYDTFLHLMKSSPNVDNPATGAYWEIQVPNGPYRVRIVAGDSDNASATQDRFQFDVEGVLTDAYVPNATPPIAHWADFTVSVAVSDGRLTIKCGPLALNNKISFVDIYPDIPVPPVIALQPQSQTNEEYRAVSLSPTLSQGSPTLVYQWYFNDALLDGATNRTLSFPHIRAANQGDYYLIVTNYGGAATTEVATLTVTSDTTPPYLVSVGSVDGTTIGISFDAEVVFEALGTADNYSVNGGAVTITNVIARPDGRSAIIQIDGVLAGPFTVEVYSMTDLAGQFTGFSQTNGTVLGFMTGDVGGPMLPGSNFTSDGNVIELVGGGADVWNTSDQFYFASKSINGDFDARVRVTALAGANTITKAVLDARETIAADSRALHVSVNPLPPGRDLAQMGYRPTNSATTINVGTNVMPSGIPNAWLRLTRVGDVFTGYRSTNAVDWVQMGQTNATFPASMILGLGVTAHDNTLLATGTFSNFKVVGRMGTVAGSSFSGGNFSAAFQTDLGVAYEVQYKDNLNDPTWLTLTNFTGDGTFQSFTNASPGVPSRFYRVINP